MRADLAVEAVDRRCATAATADELLEGLAEVVHRAIPHSGATWFGVDPVTMLATAPSRVEGLEPALCETFWHLEFHEHDACLFSDLARGDGVAGLRLATHDRPGRSARYRDFMQPQGYEDELRAVFRTGTSTWGVVGLYREGRDRFDDDDLALMRAISTTVAAALRTHVRALAPPLTQPSAPGLLVVDRGGRIVSANSDAVGWLRELWPISPMPPSGSSGPLTDVGLFDLRDRDEEVPTALFALVARARAVGDGRDRAPARLRVRDGRGRWLVLHASSLAGPGSPDGAVAVVIEAAKSAEIAPIIIEAYSLTPRERDVLNALARGASTTEIAAELFLSTHTVRDYVKAVFEKVGVSSRAELVARLFGEHYADRLHATMVHVDC